MIVTTPYIRSNYSRKTHNCFENTEQTVTFANSKETRTFLKIYCGVEQLVARWAHNPKVVGSSPTPATREDSSSDLMGSFLFVPSEVLLNIDFTKD